MGGEGGQHHELQDTPESPPVRSSWALLVAKSLPLSPTEAEALPVGGAVGETHSPCTPVGNPQPRPAGRKPALQPEEGGVASVLHEASSLRLTFQKFPGNTNMRMHGFRASHGWA